MRDARVWDAASGWYTHDALTAAVCVCILPADQAHDHPKLRLETGNGQCVMPGTLIGHHTYFLEIGNSLIRIVACVLS